MATNCFSKKDPKFMKIVLNPSDHKLKIPREFVKRYGNTLLRNCSVISLKVPTDSLWRVELTRADGEIWLQNGWKEFVEFYSIKFGHLLVFEYQGSFQFRVLVFDMTASEIEYPSQCASNSGIGSKSSDSFVSSEQILTKTKGKGKRKIQDELGSDENECDASVDIIGSTSGCDSNDSKVGAESWRGKTALKKKTSAAYEMAKRYKDNNPSTMPYFISLMHPSSVIRADDLSIPLSIAKGNLSDAMTRNLKLRVLNGKTWPVKCTIYKLSAKINSGWRNFVKDNRLKVGDVCIFQVINTTRLLLEVTIFRCRK
ncbi:hypothetical protein ABFS82_08G210600 [Erythranthe guttata]|uniref:B3 domain-containing transcription factor VRN1-like isoform X1 n=1 Tax=Erythranthe guttata TaxID=4155 RepID=UPI00064D924F|nr:PREDICTED: B3 domain-containing transcription factor VRN1-like isoform X1 [Erythranthe guttata]|eukprot:XP_012844990.1 PREDICTED: B3 domain-containing transcription factor VRN1-like isoform X1 [Erythranthe guttata]